MSLELAAKHLAAHGRGPDTHLVHMSSGEIKGLQQLAKAHGTSLTVNPHTGLPEAGVLDKFLPVVLGAASTYFTGTPYLGMAAAGLMGYEKDGLKGGLVAGLSAYGGGQLAGGLMGAGATAAGDAAAMGAYGPAAGVTDATAQAAGFGSAEEMAQVQAAQASATKTAGMSNWDKLSGGVQGLSSKAGQDAFMANMGGAKGLGTAGLMAAAPLIADKLIGTKTQQPVVQDTSVPQRLTYNPGRPVDAQGRPITPAPDVPGYGDLGRDFGRQQSYFPYAGYQAISPEQAKQLRGYAEGGMLAGGGPVEQMSNANAVGANTGFPQADIPGHAYATPWQTPISSNALTGSADTNVDPITGEQKLAHGGLSDLGGYSGGGDVKYPMVFNPVTGTMEEMKPEDGAQIVVVPVASTANDAAGLGDRFFARSGLEGDPRITDALNRIGEKIPMASVMQTDFRNTNTEGAAKGGLMQPYARGGLSDLGGYSDGGRLLRGPGDGVSDSIPATIGNKRPARLADGEFVVPARIVSELGNGSTDAGARKLYAMLDRVQKARGKTVGKGKVAKNSRADKFLPA